VSVEFGINIPAFSPAKENSLVSFGIGFTF